MQVTKNEKIVKVVQEETYDIKGLTKAEAIALLFLVSNTNGRHTRSIYDKLDEALEMDNQVGRHISLNIPTIDLHSVQHQIEKLARAG